jgi:DNA-binding transcriptional regulator GbsR (MarR family)
MATEAERRFIEKAGLLFEQLGFPRMGGRIFGWLLISASPLVSMAELVEALQASKSSISTITRLMIQVDLIEVFSLPGVRRDFYRIREDVWATTLKDRLSQANTFRGLADEGLALLKSAPAERKRRLEEMRLMYAFLEREIPLLMERWEREHRAWLKTVSAA